MKRFNYSYYQKHTNHYLDINLDKIPSFSWIKKELAVKKGEQILDAGCGTGYLLNYVAGEKTRGFGVDISPDAIKVAQNISKLHRFLQADLVHLPFKSNYFDKIICFNVIEHVKAQKKVLKEIKRILRRGGILIIGTNNKISLSWRLFKLFYGGDPTHRHEFSYPEFVDYVSSEFKILKTTRSSCIARFPNLVNRFINLFLKGDILIKAIKDGES
jgi:SAM-dependent methyltransferase